MLYITVSCSCCNKLPPVSRLRTTQMYYVVVPGSEVPRWFSLGQNQAVSTSAFLLEALRGGCPCLFQLPEATRVFWLRALPPSSKAAMASQVFSCGLPLPLFCSSLPLAVIPVITAGHPDNPGQSPHLKICNLITRKVPFTV